MLRVGHQRKHGFDDRNVGLALPGKDLRSILGIARLGVAYGQGRSVRRAAFFSFKPVGALPLSAIAHAPPLSRIAGSILIGPLRSSMSAPLQPSARGLSELLYQRIR